ncbi:hypothetical protein JK202_02100 [Gluconobacter sp. Dm-62]|uniref:hypothetical protein n=1 Tax=Gluconobacter sp. Dm-62 TaxID=2799804 RepID=UPI001B8D4CD4|nr:hypothetical protein [Gluconobacter sp. Dm-62]MBS1101815.1 hypothetical protein [Gluconobacter sp. Dm-62]
MMSDFSWLPGWAFGCLAVVAALFAMALLCMPFAVFGTKPRLQDLEFQIAELRAELRALNMRLAVSTRSENVVGDRGGQVASAAQKRTDPVSETRVVQPLMTQADEDYLMPARALRPDLPSYEDGPGQGDPETLPRRGSASVSGGARTEMPSASERAWARAPWEQDTADAGREPLARGMERKQPARTVADDEAYRSRSEPKLRWPPRG